MAAWSDESVVRDLFDRWERVWHEGRFDLVAGCVAPTYIRHAGAAAYQRDNPKAVVKMLDAGHFALETNVDDIAVAIDQLLDGG